MTFDQFISQYSGKKIDFDGAYGGQCVDLFRQYCKDVLNVPQAYPVPAYPDRGRGAADFWTGYSSTPELNKNFTQIKNTPEFVPSKGDVVIWNRNAGGGHGHIAVFTSGDVNSFKSFDQNWRALSVSEITSHNYTNVYGVLRPKVSTTPEPMPEKTSDELLVKYGVKSTQELDDKIKEHVGTDWGATKDSGYLGAARAEISSIKETVKDEIQKSGEEHDRFVEELVELLKPSQTIPNLRLESYVIQAVKDLIDENTRLTLEKKEVAKAIEYQDLADDRELKRLKESLQKIETVDVKRIFDGLEVIKQRMIVIEEKKDQRDEVTESLASRAFNKLLSKFGG